MRSRKCLMVLFIAFSFSKGIAQPGSAPEIDITGLWKGTLYNDTTKLYHRYEIGINEEKGKLSGFSHTWFLVDDKQYFGIKKVKVRRANDGKIIIEDAGLIANNYPESPAKGVRQLNVLTLEIVDSVLKLKGPFTTNRTKNYSALTGLIELQRKNDYRQSALIPHLQELGLENKLSFVAKDNELEKQDLVKSLTRSEAVLKKTSPEVSVNTKPVIIKEKSEAIAKSPIQIALPEKAGKSSKQLKDSNAIAKKEAVKQAAEESPTPEKVIKAEAEIITAKANLPAAEIDTRKTIVQQTVFFKSDSLQISLYDNGEVDGDTVSVLMNGSLLMAKQGLSTHAIRKTIYSDQNVDSIQLVMYAENLGTIAPNTGLLVVRDGKDIYEIRFSGDLQKSAAIILKRKK